MQTTRRARNIQTSQQPCAQSLAGVTNVHGRIKSTPQPVHRWLPSKDARSHVTGVVGRETGRKAIHRQLHEGRKNASPLENRAIYTAAHRQRLFALIVSRSAGVRKNFVRAQHVVQPQSITARLSGQTVGVAGNNPDHSGHIVPPGNGGPQTQDLHSNPVSRTTKSGNYTRLQSPTAPLDSGFRRNDVRSVGAMWSVVVCLQRGDH